MLKCNMCGCHENDVKVMVVFETEATFNFLGNCSCCVSNISLCNECVEILNAHVLSEYRAIVTGVRIPPEKAIVKRID